MSHYVYRYFNTDGDLLYVGCSKDPWMRYRYHHTDSRQWIHEVTRGQIAVYPDRATALVAEREAIKAEHPRYNRTHRGDRSTWTAEQYRNYALGYVVTGWANKALIWNSAHLVAVREEYAARFGAAMPRPAIAERGAVA